MCKCVFSRKMFTSLLREWLVQNPKVESLSSDSDQFSSPGFYNIPVDLNEYNKLYKPFAQISTFKMTHVMQHL